MEEAVDALGYRANTAARVLAGGRSRALGVVAVETLHFAPAHMLLRSKRRPGPPATP